MAYVDVCRGDRGTVNSLAIALGLLFQRINDQRTWLFKGGN
jgi:hypothetical protein